MVAFIANTMDPDQTAPTGFIVFASMIKVVSIAFKKTKQHFQGKKYW